MKRLIAATLAVILTGTLSQPVSAHVVVANDSNTQSAILHIIPDDEPVSGKKATINFIFQDHALQGAESVTLLIKGESSEMRPPVKIEGNQAMAEVVFNQAGVYALDLTVVSPGSAESHFRYTQRVSAGDGSHWIAPSWAEPLFIASTLLLVGLAIIAFNFRKKISQQSVLK